jgi:hypothetical protein
LTAKASFIAGMATPSLRLGKPSKVVVGCLNGERFKGFVFNFSPSRKQFRLFPEENSPHHHGTDVKLEMVKAIFFVKDFAGHGEHHDSYLLQEGTPGFSH